MLLGAHFLRGGSTVLVGVVVLLLALLAVRRRWVARVVQVALVLGTFEWLMTIGQLMFERAYSGEPVVRAALILLAVATFTAISALLLSTERVRAIYRPRKPGALVCLLLPAVACLAPGTLAAQDEAATVTRLLADLKNTDFDTAYAAAEQLGSHPAFRARIVPALVDALLTRDWNRCAGDVRDAAARSLGALGAREAVTPLLEVVKRGTPIEHECVE